MRVKAVDGKSTPRNALIFTINNTTSETLKRGSDAATHVLGRTTEDFILVLDWSVAAEAAVVERSSAAATTGAATGRLLLDGLHVRHHRVTDTSAQHNHTRCRQVTTSDTTMSTLFNC